MAHYRIYLLDDENHIREAVDLDCIDDGEAVLRTEKVADGKGAEVWQGTRRVAQLPLPQKSST